MKSPIKLDKIGYRPLLSWLSLGLLVALVCVLGVLQYRWIGEISQIEQKRLQEDLQARLNKVSRDFNSELNRACSSLLPTDREVREMGRERAYQHKYAQWGRSTSISRLFGRLALVWPEDGQLMLRMLNLKSGAFVAADWPPTWSGSKEKIQARLAFASGGAHGPGAPWEPAFTSRALEDTLIDVPRFSDSGPGNLPRPAGMGEQDWLLAEVDTGYATGVVLPELLTRHFGSNYQADYRIDVTARSNPAVTIYQTSSQRERSPAQADASVTLFDVMPQIPGRRDADRGRPGGPPGTGSPGFSDFGRGRWLLSVRLNAGSLEAVVARARQRNLAISAAILLLMLVTAGALVRFSRQAQRLANIEMEFVTSVSHELRTPLTVIRTAAFNLRGRLAQNPAQVERYGALIREESEKLTAIVEQVLQFASAKGGRVIRAREPLSVESLIDDSLQSSRGVLEDTLCKVESRIEPGLPLILGDSLALRHALQNLINNAVKYGVNGSKWIGVFAQVASSADQSMVEIRVADRGPGIPREEQRHIFDAFFRGKKAVGDQIHGTGLGLHLVKTILEAHGGTVRVESEPGAGTSFILRIPAERTEQRNEFTHSLGRG